jgi:hypothetical protein
MRFTAFTIMKRGPGFAIERMVMNLIPCRVEKIQGRNVAHVETEPLDQLAPMVHFKLSR